MNFKIKSLAIEAIKWASGAEHPKVRAPAGAHEGRFYYGVVETPEGLKPIEKGDWLVIDADGNARVWRHEHFVQVFELVSVAADIFS